MRDLRPQRPPVLAFAGLLFAAVFALRLAIDDPAEIVTVLYAMPIALVAVALGTWWGLGAAALSLALFALWDAVWADADLSAVDYLSRAAAFVVIGGVAGALSDRVRRMSAEHARFWELSADLLCTAGFDGRFRLLNPAWQGTLGWTPEELRAEPFLAFVHPEDRERTQAEAGSLTTAGHETRHFENRYRCTDGGYRTLVWSATSNPEESLIYASARDATESKRAEVELRNSARFLDSVLENLPNMVFVKDAQELRFVRFNRAGEELLGVSRDDLLGKNDYDLFSEPAADAFTSKDREVLASGEVLDIPEEPLDTVTNGTRLLHTRKVAIRDEQGEPLYLLGISEDITERRAAERAADAARTEAERANHAKSDFLSRMSHELRTPLNAVIGFAQLLQLDPLEDEQRESVEQILKAGRHLLGLINEVLDIARIEAGTMTMSLEPVHLGSVIAEALSLISPLADDAGVQLIADPSEYRELYVHADQQRLKQVLINLLSNAVKYNRRGGEIRVGCRELAGERVELAVADTGHGMTPEQLERLFEPFERLGAERTSVEGTGLGLPLSRHLTEAMGGAMTAESEPAAGTTLRIVLGAAAAPLEDGAVGSAAAAAGPRTDRRTVLYIEDNLSNLTLVERLLERVPGVRLIPAMQGQLGLELARRHQPDLILLDLHLPDLHGRDVLQALKDDAKTARIPVVVLSADATPSQVERLLAAGAADYATKPIDVEWLLDTVTATARDAPA
jgi:PAS domain S-box-containing protein